MKRTSKYVHRIKKSLKENFSHFLRAFAGNSMTEFLIDCGILDFKKSAHGRIYRLKFRKFVSKWLPAPEQSEVLVSIVWHLALTQQWADNATLIFVYCRGVFQYWPQLRESFEHTSKFVGCLYRALLNLACLCREERSRTPQHSKCIIVFPIPRYLDIHSDKNT